MALCLRTFSHKFSPINGIVSTKNHSSRLSRKFPVRTQFLEDPWRPPTTPEVGTPVRSSSVGASRSRGSRGRRARDRPPLPDPREINYNWDDSGSDLEGGGNEDGEDELDEEPMFEDVERLREAARILQDYSEARNVDDMSEIAGDVDSAAGGDAVIIPGPAEVQDFNWSTDFNSFTGIPEEYQRAPGPTYGGQKGIDIFLLMWGDIMPVIVNETNHYAWQNIGALSEHGRLTKNLDQWYETTEAEMYRYFAILMFMAIDTRTSLKEYWETGVLGMPDFRSLMSRNRFQMISRFLHFVNNEDIPHDTSSYYKKVKKIQPLVEYLNHKFNELYTPEQQLSLDESLVLWKGSLSWVQCIRSKAARFGIKLFDLCEASTGYLLGCIIYAGRNSSMHEGPLHGFTAPTAKVVLKLMDGFLDQGHILFMDNWYNQLPLSRYLKTRKTDVVGTLIRRRRHVPDMIKDINDRQLRTGERVACHSRDIAITAWKDVKLVTMITTCHGDEMEPGRRAGSEREVPICVSDYNKYMGGVDLKDKKLSMYLLERKRGLKWYQKVFRRLLNSSILNAFIIYNKNPMLRVLSHWQFRYELAQDLCARFPKETISRPIAIAPVQHLCRLNSQLQHFPIPTEVLSGGRRSKRRCARCSARSTSVRTQVTIMCSACQIGLCIGQCWLEYHTLVELK